MNYSRKYLRKITREVDVLWNHPTCTLIGRIEVYPDDDSRRIVYHVLDTPESERTRVHESLRSTFFDHMGLPGLAYLLVFVYPEVLTDAERAEILEGSFYHRPSNAVIPTPS